MFFFSNKLLLVISNNNCYIGKLCREIAEDLNLPIGHNYHAGIRKDKKNWRRSSVFSRRLVWRRSSDGVEVVLDGWIYSYPYSHRGYDFLYWVFYPYSDKNKIWNHLMYHEMPFICEF